MKGFPRSLCQQIYSVNINEIPYEGLMAFNSDFLQKTKRTAQHYAA